MLTVIGRLPDIMARPLRIQYPGAVYHVILERRDYEAFLNTVGELHDCLASGNMACDGVAARMNSDARFRDRVDSIRRSANKRLARGLTPRSVS